MYTIEQNKVLEVKYLPNGEKTSSNFSVNIQGSDEGPRRVPGFWNGEAWAVRLSFPETGTYNLSYEPGFYEVSEVHDDVIQVVEYTGDNPLFKHGGIRSSSSKSYLEHQDGTPFYWLGDTWWMGLTTRLSWPEGFQTLVDDRIKKGFNVVQIVAGLYPDMVWHDPRGANKAGFPWDEEFTEINPQYFNEADKKIQALIEAGIVPCIVGSWGYFLEKAGTDVIKRHWDNLLARYAAYPVAWCLAGEAVMPFYLDEVAHSMDGKKAYIERARAGWTRIAEYVREQDPYKRLVTIHPTQYGHKMVDRPSLLDLNMLQTGHDSFFSLATTVDMVETAVKTGSKLPVINSEACYEGICASSGADVQRFLFWSCALSGTCGHTYGANGIWQLNSKEKPYGPSPHGATWGNTTWQEAMHLPGAYQTGIGAELLRRYRWWMFEPHPEWLERHAAPEDRFAPYAAGIPGEVRVIFLPFFKNFGWGEIWINNLEADTEYRAFYFDPITGVESDLGEVDSSGGRWQSPKFTIFQDWILVLETAGARV